jgi:hypothetical protein
VFLLEEVVPAVECPIRACLVLVVVVEWKVVVALEVEVGLAKSHLSYVLFSCWSL